MGDNRIGGKKEELHSKAQVKWVIQMAVERGWGSRVTKRAAAKNQIL